MSTIFNAKNSLKKYFLKFQIYIILDLFLHLIQYYIKFSSIIKMVIINLWTLFDFKIIFFLIFG